MNKTVHHIYIYSLVSIVIGVTIYLIYVGYSYYILPIEERFYHPNYDWFKPSGLYGQGLGVIGTGMILFGVSIYILRKRYGLFQRYIRLKYLLEFHIFLCTLGPILVLFHTTFKFGGIVSIAFWSMVAVVFSGIIGRFIYIQIPRTVGGRELSLEEVQNRITELSEQINEIDSQNLNIGSFLQLRTSEEKWTIKTPIENIRKRKLFANQLQNSNLSVHKKEEIIDLFREHLTLKSRIGRLNQMKQLFKYWHVAHMPFALIMLVVVIIHIIVAFTFGYKWIF